MTGKSQMNRGLLLLLLSPVYIVGAIITDAILGSPFSKLFSTLIRVMAGK